MPVSQNLTLTGVGNGAVVPATFTVDALGRILLGDRIVRASKVLPQTATEALFTISGGRVILLAILGEVTVVVQTQACNLKLQANPTAAGTSLDICADLNVSAKAVGQMLGITGTFADALVSSLAIPGPAKGVILPVGTLDLVASASNTGEIKWQAHYVPLDAGALLVAA